MLTDPQLDPMGSLLREIIADGDVAALSSVRVMGPCIAMGAAAAHALDIAGAGSVHQIDLKALKKRVHDNIERKDGQEKRAMTAEAERHFSEAHR